MEDRKIFNQPWLVWLSGLSAGLRTKGSPVQFPVRAHAWVAGQVPSRGNMRGNHTLMFLFLSFSLPLSLKIIHKILKKKKNGDSKTVAEFKLLETFRISNLATIWQKKKSHQIKVFTDPKGRGQQGEWVWKLDLRWESGLDFAKATASGKCQRLMNSGNPWRALCGVLNLSICWVPTTGPALS